MTEITDVAGPDAARALGPEYVETVGKVIQSHVRNELAGATVFDEPAITLAPNPREKWLACRIAMEEYGHHLRFSRLASELGVEDRGRPLSVFDFELRSWIEFVVLKAVVDLAEVVLMEELLGASYLPLRDLSAKLLPEEHFHVSFGRAQAKDLASRPEHRDELQRAVDDLVGLTVPFFGRSSSANNEAYRRWGVKARTNDESRAEWAGRARRLVTEDLGLSFPDVALTWDGGVGATR